MSFVHLRLHSEYSLTDGIVRIQDVVEAAKRDAMPAVAVTDLANMFGAVKFSQAASRAGLKPILGCDLWVDNPADRHKPFRIVLLCQNREGYLNLTQLLTLAYQDGQHHGRPCAARGWLEKRSAGLICLSGGTDGELGQALMTGNSVLAAQVAREFGSWFQDRFYVELQRIGRPGEDDYVEAAVALAQQAGLPVVATNAVQFLAADDFEAHEVRVCIQDGRTLTDSRRPRLFTADQHFRSSGEMIELFADIPEAIANTVAIAQRCSFHLDFSRYFLPDYELTDVDLEFDAVTPVAEPARPPVEAVLRNRAAHGLAMHLAGRETEMDPDKRRQYQERLELELDVIIKMGFAGYFLIVADFIHWAKTNDVPVGPGRGSGAGSLVAYVLGITALDPIQYELLFERFLNPERVSLPDFDVDFCIEGRDRVIDYVKQRYGADKVSQIITHGTMAAKAVVRDVGRVLDHPYGYVDKLAKLIPHELDMTLDRAIEIEPALRDRYENEEDVRALIDTARRLEGLARSAGKHAAGVVISPSALTDFMPLYCEQGSRQFVTQFDMKDVEKIGLVKFDFLGLRNLTIIDRAVKLINGRQRLRGEPPIEIDRLPLNDPKTYTLIKSARTTALFQLESRGMKDLIQRLQPDNFEEIVALVALFRPGPLQSGMVDDFINRKHGRSAIKYPHPLLEPILKPTYGVILYQEQVMQIARVLSGYTLGGADLLRRAMGKKKPEEMAMQRDVFVKGAEAQAVPGKLASDIFDLIEKFAGYGFNRSHSAAYALIAYQTAWLKAHYPAEFMAAVLSSDMDKTDKVVTMIAECRDMKLSVLPPDVNQCGYAFSVVDAGDRPETDSADVPGHQQILYGLGALKGLGQSAIDAIVDARANGPFKDLFDFCRRVNLQKVNRRALESLIKAGALDPLGEHRAALTASLGMALAAAEQTERARAAQQDDLFNLASEPSVVQGQAPIAEVPPWTEDQRLEGEKETLGLYLTGHPIARYERELANIVDSSIAELKPIENRTVVVAGLVVGMRTMQTRRGDRMAFVTLDDRTGRMELAVFSDLYEKYRDRLTKDALLVVEGQVSIDEYSGGFKMSAERLYQIDQARGVFASGLEIQTGSDTLTAEFIAALKTVLKTAVPGHCPVVLRHDSGNAQAEIVLGAEWKVTPSGALLDAIEGLAGRGRARLLYPATRRMSPPQDGSRPTRRPFNRARAGAMTA